MDKNFVGDFRDEFALQKVHTEKSSEMSFANIFLPQSFQKFSPLRFNPLP